MEAVSRGQQPRIMLDSGAFTVWKQGKSVSLDDYIAFIQQYRESIECYAALDVIMPGNPERAAGEGFDNLRYMQGKGLDPVPVFHVRESIDWLYRMLDAGCTYIGLAGLSAGSRNAIDDWFELIWEHLIDSDGNPIVRVHAFGEARPEILLKYPWHSADASSWLKGQMYGVLFLNNGSRLSHSRSRVGISKQIPDIDSVQEENSPELVKLLTEIGVTREMFDVRAGRAPWIIKSYCAACYYFQLAEKVRRRRLEKTYRAMQSGLVVPRRDSLTAVFDPRDFTMYHALSSSPMFSAILHVAGVRTGLVSFPYVKSWMSDVATYVNDPDVAVRESPYKKTFEDLRSYLDAGK
jgi:hypothetical protein